MTFWTRLPRIGKILVALLAAVGLYAFLGAVVLPLVVARELRSVIQDTLKLRGDVVDVDFDPFDFALSIEAVDVDAPGDVRDGAFDAFSANLEVWSLLRGAIVFESIGLEGPRVLVDVDREGGLHVAGIDLSGSPPPEEPASEASEEPASDAPEEPGGGLPEIWIRVLEIRNGSLEFHDHTIASDEDPKKKVELRAGPIDVRISNLRTAAVVADLEAAARAGGAVDLSLELEGGGRIEVRGSVDPEPLALDLEVTLSDIPLAVLEPYLQRVVRLDVASGLVSNRGRLRYGDPAGAMRYTGELHLSGVELRETGTTAAPFAWSALDLVGIDLDTVEGRLSVEEVALREPRVGAVLDAQGGLDLARLAVDSEPASPPEDAPGPEPEASGEPLAVTIERIRIEKGLFTFEDRAFEPPVAIRLAPLALEATGFGTDLGARTKLDVSAKVNGQAPFSVRGALEPLRPREFTKLALRLPGVGLIAFSPYAARYVGNPIDQGKATVEIDLAVEGGSIVGANRFLVDRLEFGPSIESADATSLPVVFAVDLLKDGDGRITVDLPVKGSFDDPGFSYRGVLAKSLGTLITNVARAPFGALAGLANFSTEERRRVGFEPGQDDLVDGELEKLQVIAEALKSRPRLRLEVRGIANERRDGPAVRRLPFGRASQEALQRLADARSERIRKMLLDEGVVREQLFLRESQVIARDAGNVPGDTGAEDEAVFSQLSVSGASGIPDP